MPFSAVTCLSYTGTTTLGGVLELYSDVDGYTTPFQTNINLSAITGNQCPYYIGNIPDGTTLVKLRDVLTNCCAELSFTSNDLCTTANLDFNIYSGSTVGRIVAGNLTGVTNSAITDYRIYWYNTGDTTTPIFTSGKGTEYQPYSFTHPLTGSSAIFAPAGTYVPVIDKIKLSGLTFSQTGGTGLIPAELDCFDSTTVFVDYFKCDNGTSSNDPNYKHRVNFLSAGAGITPQPLYSDFLFTGTTNYFAWKFCGFSVEDRLRLTYYGSAYTTPIVIEDIIIGSNLSQSNFNINVTPKSAAPWFNTTYIKKVTCLTGLTRNVNDYVRMEVIPNTANTQTNWDFYFTCLDTFNQNTCIQSNNPYKIIKSTITSQTGTCNSSSVSFQVSGCSKNNVDDFTKYLVNELSTNPLLKDTSYGERPSPATFSNTNVIGVSASMNLNRSNITSYILKSNQPVCSTPSTNIITFKKYVSGGTQGVIDMEFNNINDFNAYYNSYYNTFSSFPTSTCGGGVFSGTPFNSNDIRYYRFAILCVPNSTGMTVCGDGTGQLNYYIHPSTVVTTGITGPNYTLRFTMPTITKTIVTDPCGADYTNTVINNINPSSTATTNNYTGTTLTGSRYVDPFAYGVASCSANTSTTAVTASAFLDIPKYFNETIPYTGSPATFVPSLSAKTFNFNSGVFNLNNNNPARNLQYYRVITYDYTFYLTNPLDIRDYSIYYNSGLTQTLIYSYTGATSASTVHQPSFFIL
jgi:hypothetical protein